GAGRRGAGGLLRRPRADRRRRGAGLEGAPERRTADLRGPSAGHTQYRHYECRARRGEAAAGRPLRGLRPDVPVVARNVPPALGTPARVNGLREGSFLLGVDPAVGPRQLDGHIRERHPHGRAISAPGRFGGKRGGAGLFVAPPRGEHERGFIPPATMIDEILDSVVVPDVKVPSISRRVAALRRIFYRHQLRGAFP